MPLDLSKTAKKLIRKLAGTSELGVFYICYSEGEIKDPDTGQVFPGVDIKCPVDGALVGYSDGLTDGTNIKSGDRKLILAYDAPIPFGNWWVEVYGQRLSIVNNKQINPSGQVQIYILQLRSS